MIKTIEKIIENDTWLKLGVISHCIADNYEGYNLEFDRLDDYERIKLMLQHNESGSTVTTSWDSDGKPYKASLIVYLDRYNQDIIDDHFETADSLSELFKKLKTYAQTKLLANKIELTLPTDTTAENISNTVEKLNQQFMYRKNRYSAVISILNRFDSHIDWWKQKPFQLNDKIGIGYHYGTVAFENDFSDDYEVTSFVTGEVISVTKAGATIKVNKLSTIDDHRHPPTVLVYTVAWEMIDKYLKDKRIYKI